MDKKNVIHINITLCDEDKILYDKYSILLKQKYGRSILRTNKELFLEVLKKIVETNTIDLLD